MSHLVLFVRILQTPAAYVPLDPEAPGFLSARVIKQCGLKYCAVKTDLLQVLSDISMIVIITIRYYMVMFTSKINL